MATDNETAILLTEFSSGVLRLTLNRPEQRNALSAQLIDDLISELEACHRNPAIRVVVIAAAGPAFSAGHDLNELITMDESQQQHLLERCSELMMILPTLEQPVIAQVQGVATAAGCQLVASCDLAIAGESASFATPGVNIGLFCSTPAVALSRAVPDKQALKMLFTGEAVSAEQALAMGLISDRVADAELSRVIADLARLIVSKSAPCIGNGKRAFYRQQGLPRAEAYADASEEMVVNLGSASAAEGIEAFLQKRSPVWPD